MEKSNPLIKIVVEKTDEGSVLLHRGVFAF